mmetsp:Transcript_583/g.1384  ORF Transcript_583/g.1384 Transcript_583/m.1384 type:complete len:234 (-) Transcript_583:957-1658(-)
MVERHVVFRWARLARLDCVYRSRKLSGRHSGRSDHPILFTFYHLVVLHLVHLRTGPVCTIGISRPTNTGRSPGQGIPTTAIQQKTILCLVRGRVFRHFDGSPGSHWNRDCLQFVFWMAVLGGRHFVAFNDHVLFGHHEIRHADFGGNYCRLCWDHVDCPLCGNVLCPARQGSHCEGMDLWICGCEHGRSLYDCGYHWSRGHAPQFVFAHGFCPIAKGRPTQRSSGKGGVVLFR